MITISSLSQWNFLLTSTPDTYLYQMPSNLHKTFYGIQKYLRYTIIIYKLRYNWNIVESAVKHHNLHPISYIIRRSHLKLNVDWPKAAFQQYMDYPLLISNPSFPKSITISCFSKKEWTKQTITLVKQKINIYLDRSIFCTLLD